jgi:hypothetical protein
MIFDEQAIRFDGLDDAIIGVDHNNLLVYDYDKMISIFCDQGMTDEEAIEWIDFNVIATNGGVGFVIFMKEENIKELL